MPIKYNRNSNNEGEEKKKTLKKYRTRISYTRRKVCKKMLSRAFLKIIHRNHAFIKYRKFQENVFILVCEQVFMYIILSLFDPLKSGIALPTCPDKCRCREISTLIFLEWEQKINNELIVRTYYLVNISRAFIVFRELC